MSFGGVFTPDQFDRMEQKGLVVKRESSSDGGLLSFYRGEFEAMYLNWRILREIELWNDRGVVDLREVLPEKPKGAKACCPGCFAATDEKQKFCSNCGRGLGEAEAA